jgi:hypothetical protein
VIPWPFQWLRTTAAGVGSAARVGGRTAGALLVGAALLAGCRAPGPGATAAAPAALPPGVWSLPQPPGATERSCAWYGDSRDGVLYFGISAFWSASRLRGSPLGDREEPGPRRIGRFDLARLALLPPLELGPDDAPTGVWDVLAHPNGRVYYTTWFDAMGWVDPASGESGRFEALGRALNEIALGPGGKLLVSRYGDGGDAPASGSLVLASEEGELVAEYPLAAPPGYVVVPKTVGYDARRGELWATTDGFPTGEGPTRHDGYVLDQAGGELRRFERPELQFVAFRPDGSGVMAEVDRPRLSLRIRAASGEERVVVADESFPPTLDFVQDIHLGDDGSAVVTRWSGFVHRLAPDGALATLRLPKIGDDGLYYSGVRAGGRVCATHCGGIEVACARAPEHAPAPAADGEPEPLR